MIEPIPAKCLAEIQSEWPNKTLVFDADYPSDNSFGTKMLDYCLVKSEVDGLESWVESHWSDQPHHQYLPVQYYKMRCKVEADWVIINYFARGIAVHQGGPL